MTIHNRSSTPIFFHKEPDGKWKLVIEIGDRRLALYVNADGEAAFYNDPLESLVLSPPAESPPGGESKETAFSRRM